MQVKKDLYLKKSINILLFFLFSNFDKSLIFLKENEHRHDHVALIIVINLPYQKHIVDQNYYMKELFIIFQILSPKSLCSFFYLNIRWFCHVYRQMS